MNLKASFAATVFGLVAGVGCSSSSTPEKAPAAGVVETTVTTAKAFDAVAYCVEKLEPMAVKYPKSFAGGDLRAECQKMIRETDASSAKTIDVLLETAETYYKAIG